MKLRNLSYVIIIGLVGGFALMASTGGTKRAIKKQIIIKQSINDLSLEEQLTEPPTGGRIWEGGAAGFAVNSMGDTFQPFASWVGTVYTIPQLPPWDPRPDSLAVDSIHGNWVDTVYHVSGEFWAYRRSGGYVEYGIWWVYNTNPLVEGTWKGQFGSENMTGNWYYISTNPTNSYSGDIWGHKK